MGSIKLPSSAALTSVRHTPSKLVIRGSSDLIVFTIIKQNIEKADALAKERGTPLLCRIGLVPVLDAVQ